MKIELSRTPSEIVEAGEKPYFIRVYDRSAVFFDKFIDEDEIEITIKACTKVYLDSPNLNMDLKKTAEA